ncbi:MAG: hypothetical protein QM539_10710, partial [Alphaproteobacteria bacterium]|nr:hypothetical protein [Alphaproteobacteria bacterium]
MKHTLFYMLLFISNLGNSQKLIDIKDQLGPILSNTYVYDNELNKFVGEWIYSNGNEVFKLILKKTKMDISKTIPDFGESLQNCYTDKIVCYFDYRKNNVIILSNYDSLKNPVPTFHNRNNENIFYCYTVIKGTNESKRNVLECLLKDPPKRHANRLFLTINKDLNILTSKNTYGPGGVQIIKNDSEGYISGFTFPDNMTLKKVK